MEPLRIWRTGERCTITYEGRTVPGEVVLASPNGISLMLGFDSLLGGHLGFMPVWWTEGNYCSLITDKPVTITP